ncbi:hypothetical protein I302_103604 [Kwoniella bestiolae CBS 10118]|uniref:alpha-1,2-Mannosidase n=1 Tax=Kwoniella bestiolae CBS 10118 TaxID=1296100 RepID=A0A1B9G8U6_9TREE|nr:hypothetical protein I302_02306 [Kwoniella bestiolae CBS 10118]OCF27464.1 hypothetical protein I302_02306 [Kwoniella bestiolae CBS 10118]
MRRIYAAWLILLLHLPGVWCMSEQRREELRVETASLFKHGYEGYMKYAYPADELRPLSCGPLHRDPDPNNIGINDIHANVSMTLLDVLSSLPLIHPSAFPKAVQLVAEKVSFDQDVKVQVFELTIRALGALLSTYQTLDDLPDDPSEQFTALGLSDEGSLLSWSKKSTVDVKQYKGRILELAHDLGKRLLPAFDTITGIPYARVNLKYGVLKGESIETCTAGAGSLLLEFALLSRLTNDDRFERLAHSAYLALWNRRSAQNLLGNTIGTHGHWLAPGMSGVGAGMDSFFEYGVKAGVMLDDDTYNDIFYDSYAAIQTYIRTNDGFIYRPIQTRLLQPANPSTIDSLSAFLPAMQVLAGDVVSAIKSHLVFWNLWRKHDAMPESWLWQERKTEWTGYPGRPEFIESTYYLYQATKDPFYLRVGEKILSDLKKRTKTKCGFATLKNVMTGEQEDRMESFMLSESLKYLYLLFADTPFPNSNTVFTTEGHPLRMPKDLLKAPSTPRRAMRKGENPTCPVYRFVTVGSTIPSQGIIVGIEGREDYDYARSLIYGWDATGVDIEDGRRIWYDGGICKVPSEPKFAFEIVLSPLNVTDPTAVPPEDPSPGPSKVEQDLATGDYVISDIEGLRLGVRWRFDGRGYDVANIGPHRIRQGQNVIVQDPAMRGHLPIPSTPPVDSHSPPELLLRFISYPASTAFVNIPSSGTQGQILLHAVGATATFGIDFVPISTKDSASSSSLWRIGVRPIRLIIPPKVDNQSYQGCAIKSSEYLGINHELTDSFVLVVSRGGCTFLEKLEVAKKIGAIGVLVVGHAPLAEGEPVPPEGQGFEEGLIRPSAEFEESHPKNQAVRDVGMIYTEWVIGEVLRRIVEEENKLVAIEILSIDADAGARAESDYHKDDSSWKGREKNEGLLMVGQWPIMNLRVIDRYGGKPP